MPDAMTGGGFHFTAALTSMRSIKMIGLILLLQHAVFQTSIRRSGRSATTNQVCTRNGSCNKGTSSCNDCKLPKAGDREATVSPLLWNDVRIYQPTTKRTERDEGLPSYLEVFLRSRQRVKPIFKFKCRRKYLWVNVRIDCDVPKLCLSKRRPDSMKHFAVKFRLNAQEWRKGDHVRTLSRKTLWYIDANVTSLYLSPPTDASRSHQLEPSNRTLRVWSRQSATQSIVVITISLQECLQFGTIFH